MDGGVDGGMDGQIRNVSVFVSISIKVSHVISLCFFNMQTQILHVNEANSI